MCPRALWRAWDRVLEVKRTLLSRFHSLGGSQNNPAHFEHLLGFSHSIALKEALQSFAGEERISAGEPKIGEGLLSTGNS